MKAEIGYAVAATTGTLAVTFAPGRSATLELVCTEYSFGGSVSLDTTSGSNGSGTSLSSGSFTTSATDLVVGFGVSRATSTTWTVQSGFNSLAYADGSLGVAFLAEDNLSVASGSQTVTATSSVSGVWACIGIGFKAGGSSLVAAEAHDAPAFSGGFKSPASAAKTESHDTFASSAVFTSPGSMAKTEAHDAFAGSAGFNDPGSAAKTEAGDTLAGSGHFNAPGSLARTESHDVFAGVVHNALAALARTESHDAFAGSAMAGFGSTLGPTESHDVAAIFARVSPFLQATEHRDTFAGSGAATGGPASMAKTEGHDVFAAAGGFTYDTVAAFSPTETGDHFAGIAIQSAAGTTAKTEHGDIFAAHVAIANPAHLTVTESGDVFRGGHERVAYHVYANTGAGDPINYDSVIDTTAGLTYTTAPLSYPGTWSFGVRAFYVVSGLEEHNLDCYVTIILDAAGHDITNRPAPPIALRAFPLAAGGIRVEWIYPLTYGAKTPTGFHTYIGTGGTPNYTTPVATTPYGSRVANSYVANLAGYTDGTTYTVGVRAYNATAEETNTNTVNVTAIAAGPAPVVSLTAVATS